MKLHSLKMTDFRQYKGEQSIQFSADNRNVTVIMGVNGKGKTGIYRAIMFGLFGQRTLAQDKKDADIKLINIDKLQKKIGEQVIGGVEIVFVHENYKYSITRELMGTMSKSKKVMERVGKCGLNIEDLDFVKARKDFTDDVQIKIEIDKVMDESIREFFFFDGERVSSLAETDKEMRKAVRLGIEKLLAIDKLARIQSVAGKEYSKLQKKLTIESNDSNLENLREQINQVKSSIIEIESKMNTNENEKKTCEVIVSELGLKLDKNKDIERISLIVNEQKNTLRACVDHINSTKAFVMQNIFQEAPMHIVEDLGIGTSSYLDQLIENTDELIPRDLIQRILAEGSCICGQKVNKGTDLYEAFSQLIERSSYSEKMQLIGQIKTHFQDVNASGESFQNAMLENLKTIRLKKDESKVIAGSLQDLEERKKMLSMTESEYKELYRTLEMRNEDLKKIEYGTAQLRARFDDQKKVLEKKELEYQESLQANDKISKELKKLDLLKRVDESLKSFNNDFIKEMSLQLTDETTSVLKSIIQKSDVDTISQVHINENFELSVTFESGIEMSDDISKGQREMVALAFVTALAKTASNDHDIIDFPLFMDTPFGRLSSENRENLLKFIPSLTSQWILLTTDTEMTVIEQSVLNETGRVGRTYRIDKLSAYHSVVEEVR